MVPSPIEVDRQMEEMKGSVLEVKNDRLNIIQEHDYFDNQRPMRTTSIRETGDWDAAGEDSDEGFQPLTSIVPNHLKSKDDEMTFGQKQKGMTSLE